MWWHTSVSCDITTSTTTSPHLHGHHNCRAHSECPHRAKPQQFNHFLKGGVWGQVLKWPMIDKVRSHSFFDHSRCLGSAFWNWKSLLSGLGLILMIGLVLLELMEEVELGLEGEVPWIGSFLTIFLVIFDVWRCVWKLTSTTFRTRFYLVIWFGFFPVRSTSSSWCPSHLPPHYHCPLINFLLLVI